MAKVKDNTVYYELGGQSKEVKAECVLMCVGRVANTEGLNAEGIGLEFEKRNLKVDDHLRTNIPNIDVYKRQGSTGSRTFTVERTIW